MKLLFDLWIKYQCENLSCLAYNLKYKLQYSNQSFVCWPHWTECFLWFALGDKEITPLITMVWPALGLRITVSWPRRGDVFMNFHIYSNASIFFTLRKFLWYFTFKWQNNSFKCTICIILSINHLSNPPHSPVMDGSIVFLPFFFCAGAAASCHPGGFCVLSLDLLLSCFVLGFKKPFFIWIHFGKPTIYFIYV